MAVMLPEGVDTILDLIGVGWPNVDEDAYRDMATDLREFADDVDEDAHSAHRGVQRLLSSGESEALTALSGYWGKVKGKHLTDLAGAARIFADAMDAAAGIIEARKLVAVGELTACAASAGISLAAAPFTAGLSALIGAGAIQACRIAVKRAIKEMLQLAVEEIVTAMTEPAVAALENMAAELVVQIAANGLGIQDGYDMGDVEGAGKEGFEEGVQSGKESLQLASAGGGAPSLGGIVGKLDIDHGEHDRAAVNLNNVSTSLNGRTTSKLSKAKRSHGRTRGSDEIAQAIDTVADKMMGSIEKATKDLGDHMGGGLPKGVKNISDAQRGTDQRARDRFNAMTLPDGGRDGSGGNGGPTGNGPGGTGPGSTGRGGDRSPHTRPDSLRNTNLNPRVKGVPLIYKKCLNDPIDVATGEMTLAQTDLALPGVLPLVLRRTHLSEYRFGHWFGRSWASTLDERLQIEGDGSTYWAREDGSTLLYRSLPEAVGDRVMPVEGPRHPLIRLVTEPGSPSAFAVSDPHTGLIRRFAAVELPGNIFDAAAVCWLEEISDLNGNRVEIVRDTDNVPMAVTHSGGYRVEVNAAPLDDDGPVRVTGLDLRTPDGPVELTSYGYDGHGHLKAVANASGLPLRFTYDPDGRITSWTDRNDSTFRYVYDDSGRVAQTIGPDGFLSATFSYDLESRVTRYSDSTGAVTVLQLNDLGQVIAETDPLGNTELRQWDRYDNLVSRTDALGNAAHFTWDEQANLTSVRYPDGRESITTYNVLNLPEELTGPDGETWRHAYDDRGNRLSVVAPDGSTTRFTYDSNGALVSSTDPAGAVHLVTNNSAGVPVSVNDPHGNVSAVSRDAFARPVDFTALNGSVTRMEWTPEGWLSRRIGPDGNTESWSWDSEGHCTSHTDGTGATTHFEYTHFDRLAARIGADGARYSFTYDSELRLREVINPQEATWRYEYDSAGRLASETDFDNRTVTYTHDAAGRATARTIPDGGMVRTVFDALGRPVSKEVDGQFTEYAYNASGSVERISSPTSTLTCERDALGRLLAETVDGLTTRWTYDAAGRRTTRTTPSGARSEFSYDATGNCTELLTSGGSLSFTHDPAGLEITRSFGSADSPVTLASNWNASGSLASQSLTSGARTLRDRSYGYRADGHLERVTDQLGGTSRTFGLDPVGRPIKVTAENWSESYAYDAAGNQTSADWPDRAPHPEARGDRTYTGTRLLTAGQVRYEYDAAGRTVLRQKTRLSKKPDTWRYTWDAEDRLTTCTTPDGSTWCYLYDPLGRRTSKRQLTPLGDIAGETLFTWDGTRLAEQVDTVTNTVLTWDHDGHRPLTQTERRLDPNDQTEIDTRFFAIVTDLVGTPTELVDETGEIAWHTRSTLWGTTTWNRDATAYTPLRFPGQYADLETGLHYNYFRHYDPDTARYVSPDPLGLSPSPNPVAYVTNPHGFMDPEGLIAKGCTEEGGWYSGLKPANLKDDNGNRRTSQDMEINHIPAKDAYKHLGEPGFINGAGMGPAIRMEYDDHRALMSTGSGHASEAWRAAQRQLIDNGQWDESMKMDIGDIRSRFGNKYDDHIADMVESLKDNGKFQAMLDKHGWTINYDLLK